MMMMRIDDDDDDDDRCDLNGTCVFNVEVFD